MSGKRLWGLQRFTTDCTSRAWRSHTGTLLDQEEDISESCLQLMHQLCKDQKSGKVSSLSSYLKFNVDICNEQNNWTVNERR